MLRAVIAVSLLLWMALTGIGLAVARQWGWSEYAAEALYVIYYQGAEAAKQYFIVKADGTDGTGAGEMLGWKGDSISALDCSPDGRTLALVTGDAHLFVVNRDGLLYDRALDQPYDDLRVANSGLVAISQLHTKGDKRVVALDSDYALDTPDDDYFDAPEIASSGAALWTIPWTSGSDYGVKAISADGRLLMFLPGFSAPTWLASEQTFSLFDYSSEPYQQYLIDLTTQERFRLPATSFVLSPDGTKAVDWVGMNTGLNTKITTRLFLYDFLRPNSPQITLAQDTGVASHPLCFLSFRPAMLIS